MSDDPIKDKWDKIYSNETEQQWPAAEVLAQNTHLLPSQGEALDLACGYGGNAILLAQHGLNTQAWDLSTVAIDGLKKHAKQLGLSNLHAQACDILQQPLPPASFDVVVIAHFLHRELCQSISQSLKSGGLLYYQTFITEKAQPGGPSSADFLLKKNELLNLFSALSVVVYREEGLIGNVEQGFRNKAMFIGQKI